MAPSTCFLTPSYIRDIEQFAIQRRSLNLFAAGLPHLAIVNTEDCARFHEQFRGETNLEIIPTAAVLPNTVELHRRKSGPKWLTGSWRHGRRLIEGWHAQQLAKIHALAECRFEHVVFLDSDVFLCRRLEADFFHVDGRLKLFRCRAANAESLDFDISTHDILGNPLHQVTRLYDYIFSPACFRKSSAIALLDEFKRRHRSTWVRRFLAQKRPSEYNLLGYAATVLERCAGYELTECQPNELHHSIRFPEDRARLAEEIERMRVAPKRFALIQSTIKLPTAQIASVFERVAATEREKSRPSAT